jgi:hypothetical protein
MKSQSSKQTIHSLSILVFRFLITYIRLKQQEEPDAARRESLQ